MHTAHISCCAPVSSASSTLCCTVERDCNEHSCRPKTRMTGVREREHIATNLQVKRIGTHLYHYETQINKHVIRRLKMTPMCIQVRHHTIPRVSHRLIQLMPWRRGLYYHCLHWVCQFNRCITIRSVRDNGHLVRVCTCSFPLANASTLITPDIVLEHGHTATDPTHT